MPRTGDVFVSPTWAEGFSNTLLEAMACGGPLGSADLVLAPQGVGDHVDHLLTARAVAAVAPAPRTGWWRDLPYAARTPRADTGSRHGGARGPAR